MALTLRTDSELERALDALVALLTSEGLLHIARRTLGELHVRDVGLLEAAAARKDTSVFGADAYQTIHLKVAALMQSITRNLALVDGNKRLTLAAAFAAVGSNGWRFTLTNDEVLDLVIAVATGELSDVAQIAARMERSVEPF